mmetsp:Transcript_19196/g.24208  ORF Transcript_19196/g.24208 Transcript_19196/m.24208 type:complete len:376 (-) Transcript_19196:437-1564(-)
MVRRDLPENFNWCDEGLCTASWNQHIPQYCGACYVHGALSSANDRIKIQMHRAGYKGPDVILSRQSFLNCAPAHGLGAGCEGGLASEVFEFMAKFGLPDETCLPYNATDNSKYDGGFCPPEGYCMNCFYATDKTKVAECFPITKMVKYYASDYGYVSGEDQMMEEIHKNGPIACEIHDSGAFTYDYTAGVFEEVSWKPEGVNGNASFDHVIEVLGWGVDEDGTKFWEGRNSWGSYWGMNSFFRIKRGVNALRIEEHCDFVHVNVSQAEDVLGDDPLFGGGIWGLRLNKDPRAQRFDLSYSVEEPEKTNTNSAVSQGSQFPGYLVACFLGVILGVFISKVRKNKKILQKKAGNVVSNLHQKATAASSGNDGYETIA